MLFLITALILGALAYNVHNPVLYAEKPTVVSFVAGWLTGELAVQQIAVQAAVVLLFWQAGGIQGLSGAVGMLIVLISWLALWRFHADAGSLPRSLGMALDAGLGTDWRSDLGTEARSRLQTQPDQRDMLLPIRPISSGVEVIKDRPYGNYDQTLDIYRRRGSGANAPVLLQIHGGAWTENMGSKNEQALPLMNLMAERHGLICVACSYRLSPTATFPEHLIDCKQAVVWIKDNIAEYGGNRGFVAVTGGSAGGHLSALLALTPSVAAFQPGFEERDTRISAAVPYYGMYDFTGEYALDNHAGGIRFIEDRIMKTRVSDNLEQYRASSPLHNVTPEAPPFLIVHGTHDSLVALAHGRALHQKLKAVSDQPAVYFEIPGAQHAFDMFASPRSEHVKFGVAQFLTWCYETRKINPPMAKAVADLATQGIDDAAANTPSAQATPD